MTECEYCGTKFSNNFLVDLMDMSKKFALGYGMASLIPKLMKAMKK